MPNTDKKPRALIGALSKPDGASIDELLQGAVNGVFGERGIVDVTQSPSAATALLLVAVYLGG